MNSERLLSAVAVLAVIVISAGFFISSEPEASSVTSADGVVTVTGLARQTQPLTIASNAAVASPLLGASYIVAPDSITLDEPAVIAFNMEAYSRVTDPSLASIYRFHRGLDMWEPVAPVVANTNEVLAVETSQLGEFAVGVAPVFEAPVFANVYDELRTMAPDNAVGYETAVGFYEDFHDHELVRLMQLGEHGGCGGAVRVGDGEASSRLERKATVEIDGESRTLSFVFVTRWFTSSNGGCTQAEPLLPLSEYAILEEIQN